MAHSASTAKEHSDCRHMALALEGIAGALHSGRPVEPNDLGAAAAAAEKVWDAGPEPNKVRDHEFQEARAKFLEGVRAGPRSGAREAAAIERAAQGMAVQLRAVAQESDDRPGRGMVSSATILSMAQLSAKYARYGIRAAA
jgi:hypothetical protein